MDNRLDGYRISYSAKCVAEYAIPDAIGGISHSRDLVTDR